MSDILDKLDTARRNCNEDANDIGRDVAERAFYSGQAEGYRLAAQWLREAAK